MPSDRPSTNPPSLQDILRKVERGRQYFSAFWAQCRQEEDYYFGRFDVPAPEGFEPIKPATARYIINTIADHIDTDNLNIEVPPRSPRARKQAEALQQFYLGAWHIVQQKAPILHLAAKQAALYGITFLKVVFDPDRWPDRPEPEEGETDAEYRARLRQWQEEHKAVFPLDVLLVNPTQLIWDDSHLRMRWAIEIHSAEWEDIAVRFPEWAETGFKNSETVEFIEYWDEEWVAYIADGRWAMPPRQHGYGFLPYVPVHPAQSIYLDEGRPEDRYQGILRPIHDLLTAQARLLTQYEAILRASAWPNYVVKGPSHKRQAVEIDLTPGSYTYLDEDVTVSPLAPPTPPNQILSLLQAVDAAIEEATFPSVVRGVRPVGAASGYMTAVLAGMARLVFGAISRGLARAVQGCNERLAMLVENVVRGPITVWARTPTRNIDKTISPDDIRGYYTNLVTFEASAPEDQERRSMLGLRLFQGGLISRLYAKRNYLGIPNPTEDEVQRMAEQFAENPAVQAVFAQAAARELGIAAELQQAAQEIGSNPTEILRQLTGRNLGNRFMGGGTSVFPRPEEAQRTVPSTRPVIPGSLEEAEQLAEQITNPERQGPLRGTGGEIP